MAEQLRILVVLPMYGGSLPIGRYCAKALEALGHSVRVFNAPVFHAAFTGIRELDIAPEQMGALEHSFLQVIGQAIWAHVESLEPHLVLALAQAPLGRGMLQRLRRKGVRTAMWFVEDHAVFDYWRVYAPLYDVFAVIQKEPFLEKLQSLGQENALYLPMAALPDFHALQQLTPQEMKEYGADIGFLGAGYPNRRLAFRPLAGKDFKIWGSDWEGESLLRHNIQRNGARINEVDGVKVYSASRININLHSSLQTESLVSHGDFVNPRTFELASMGAFQLVDKRSLMPELFAEDELATFATIEEFYQKIEFFLTHEDERRAFCQKGQKRVLAEHTYSHRMQTLLDFCRAKCGAWPETARTGGADNLPPAMQEEVTKLLRELNLGPNAAFDDVLANLRRRSGELSEIETSLLFLDEWRKEYLKRA